MEIQIREVYVRNYKTMSDIPEEAKEEALLMNEDQNQVGCPMRKDNFAGAYAVSVDLDTMGWK